MSVSHTSKAPPARAPAVPSPLVRALRVAEVEARRFRGTWQGTITTSFVTPLLFLGALGIGLGSLVDRGAGDVSLGDISFVAFVAPGMLAATLMQVAASECSFPVIAGLKWQRNYHAAVSTPVTVADLVAGSTMWVLVRALMTGVTFALVAALVGAAALPRLLLAVPPAAIGALAVGLPIMAFAARTDEFANIAIVHRFIVLPMFLLSGTFFPVTQLPEAMGVVARVLPLYHAVELARALTLGEPPELAVWVHVAVPLAYMAVGAVLAHAALRPRLWS